MHTTSPECDEDEDSRQIDEYDCPIPLKVTFSSRSTCNKLLFAIYKIFRIAYVSVYYYFFPFGSLILSCLIPVLNRRILGDYSLLGQIQLE